MSSVKQGQVSQLIKPGGSQPITQVLTAANEACWIKIGLPPPRPFFPTFD